MIERLSNLPKGDPRRDAIAEQLRSSRQNETGRIGAMVIDRDGQNYLQELQGVETIFNYAATLESNRVLDIGAGTTKGIAELRDSNLSKGLSFEGTVLKQNPDIDENLGRDNVHHTGIESLQGIEDSSIGIVLGVYSVAYSDDPELAVSSIDRVLVPGGVFKGVFLADTEIEDIKHWIKSLKSFEAHFKDLGYDIADQDRSTESNILLAIKPGAPHAIAAQVLLDQDNASLDDQIEKLRDSAKSL